MSTIQNIKNFIRHGKQARLVTPHAEPTTNVSTIHAEQQPQPVGQYSPALEAFDTGDRQGQNAQKTEQSHRDRSVEIERLVAEENSNRSKMPKYPGLERWVLVEKMGDGAFSNVYRAKDVTGQFDEVAIKVVRKFEMNSNQVGELPGILSFPFRSFPFSFACKMSHGSSQSSPHGKKERRKKSEKEKKKKDQKNQRQCFTCSLTLFIQLLRRSQRLRRCATLPSPVSNSPGSGDSCCLVLCIYGDSSSWFIADMFLRSEQTSSRKFKLCAT
jgi:hypothetical protein